MVSERLGHAIVALTRDTLTLIKSTKRTSTPQTNYGHCVSTNAAYRLALIIS